MFQNMVHNLEIITKKAVKKRNHCANRLGCIGQLRLQSCTQTGHLSVLMSPGALKQALDGGGHQACPQRVH